jgi:hypothetical protein
VNIRDAISGIVATADAVGPLTETEAGSVIVEGQRAADSLAALRRELETGRRCWTADIREQARAVAGLATIPGRDGPELAAKVDRARADLNTLLTAIFAVRSHLSATAARRTEAEELRQRRALRR